MMDQVNLSRLSHGVRAAAMMRRCLNEALAAARSRHAFGARHHRAPAVAAPAHENPRAGRAGALHGHARRAHDGPTATPATTRPAALLRILTPLLKLRACRDNIPVATGAMEVRGGNGYIEEWVNARLVRDAHIGVLWEGTSNINAHRCRAARRRQGAAPTRRWRAFLAQCRIGRRSRARSLSGAA